MRTSKTVVQAGDQMTATHQSQWASVQFVRLPNTPQTKLIVLYTQGVWWLCRTSRNVHYHRRFLIVSKLATRYTSKPSSYGKVLSQSLRDPVIIFLPSRCDLAWWRIWCCGTLYSARRRWREGSSCGSCIYLSIPRHLTGGGQKGMLCMRFSSCS